MALSLKIALISLLLLLTPALTFWIWLLRQAFLSSIQCPTGCWCEPMGDSVDCSDSKLQDIPQNYGRNISILMLDHNNLNKLKKKIFLNRGIAHLDELSLAHCNLSDVDTEAFNGLVIFSVLSMNNNILTELKVGTFQNMKNIKFINLSNNRIEKLEAGIFEDLISATVINLDNNLLRNLKMEIFVGLSSLTALYLSYNRLHRLGADVFTHLHKINELTLDNNYRLQIPSDSTFINSQTLEELNISKCNISLITAKSIENITRLRALDLSSNNLSHIDKDMFTVIPKLSRLILYGNPLECDCDLLEVWRWCLDHNIKLGRGKHVPKCESPEEVSDMWWGVLEKSYCRNETIVFEGDYKFDAPEFTETVAFDFDYKSYFNVMKYLDPIISTILYLFGAIGNLTVLIVITRNSEMHTVPNAYIFTLAISDFLSLTMHVLNSFQDSLSELWNFSEFLCKIFAFIYQSSIGSSPYFIAVLSIQRYQVIARPLQNKIHPTRTRTVTAITIVGIWILASLFAIPHVISLHVDEMGMCTSFSAWKYYEKVVIFELLVICILPLCVIIFMYGITALYLIRSTNVKSGVIHNQGNVRRNAARMMLSLAIVFVVSFLPSYALWTFIVVNLSKVTIKMFYVYTVSSYLLLFNSCFNPLALYWSSSLYRSYFKRYLFRCCTNEYPVSRNTINMSVKD
ncbi:uncharacterized protein [Periplaneta americana]|uniref:uncharacterized protein n=1 Tax=Periplaneta americana TaxID=6978 RepID=UPI0037E77B64